MSLDWDLREIENHEEVCFTKRKPLPSEGDVKTDDDGMVRIMNPLTEVIIFSTISVKIGHITEENADEFYARLKFAERFDGPFLYEMVDGEKIDHSFTARDVKAHIGLKCNVIDESRAKFLAGYQQDLDRFRANYKRELARKEEPANA